VNPRAAHQFVAAMSVAAATLSSSAEAQCDGVWVQRNPPEPSPTPRSHHAMAFDAARGVVVLFGGTGPKGFLDDTWEWDGSVWTEVTPPAGPDSSPTPRFGHAMVYDPIRHRIVLFGGIDGPYRADTWEWDGAQWIPVATTSASERAYHGMAYDIVGARTILLDGFHNQSGAIDDMWEWDEAMAVWNPIGGLRPGVRANFGMTHCSATGTVFAVGGSAPGGQARNDVWEWNGVAWNNIEPQPPGVAPEARLMHVLVDSPPCQGVLLFGGTSQSASRHGDLWLWNGTAWSQLDPGSPSPVARNRSAAAFDSARGRVVLFGGSADEMGVDVDLGDTWEWISPPPTPCPDLSGDGTVGFADVLEVLAQWGPANEGGDADGDGDSDFNDILLILATWGQVCPD